MDAPKAGYQLGSDAVELERLNRQGMVLAPATRMILQAAGIDNSPEAVATAQARAQQRGLGNVRFVVGDIHEPAPGGPSTRSSAAWC
jgi:SAM-dependent methyltransferase